MKIGFRKIVLRVNKLKKEVGFTQRLLTVKVEEEEEGAEEREERCHDRRSIESRVFGRESQSHSTVEEPK